MNGIAYPLTAYVFYHHRVLQELEKERFNAETVRQIEQEYRQIANAFLDIDENERETRRQQGATGD